MKSAESRTGAYLPEFRYVPKSLCNADASGIHVIMRSVLHGILLCLLAGCAAGPQPVLSKQEAVSRVRTVSLKNGNRRLELPASNTGTGAHDFYSMFVRLHDSAPAAYGIGVATSGKVSQADVAIEAIGFGRLNVEAKQQVSALVAKVDYFEVSIPRELLDASAVSGMKLLLTSQGRELRFDVPHWMISALVDVADAKDYYRRSQKAAELARAAADERVRSRQMEREYYVAENPSLDERLRQAILRGELALGMSREDAAASWGKPRKVNRTVSVNGIHEQWVYESVYVYFNDGRLTSWQD